MNIFHKTEVQIVILGTERVYILIGSKVMTQMQKMQKGKKCKKQKKYYTNNKFFLQN